MRMSMYDLLQIMFRIRDAGIIDFNWKILVEKDLTEGLKPQHLVKAEVKGWIKKTGSYKNVANWQLQVDKGTTI